MRDETHLAITIGQCPECRDLRQQAPFCFLNQGIITEFAARYLDTRVRTDETRALDRDQPRGGRLREGGGPR
jgi:predicted hydrocarbon binding protein